MALYDRFFLLNDTHPEAVRGLAGSPNTPPEELCVLAEFYPECVLRNPSLALHMIGNPALYQRILYNAKKKQLVCWELKDTNEARIRAYSAVLLRTLLPLYHDPLATEVRELLTNLPRAFLKAPSVLQHARTASVFGVLLALHTYPKIAHYQKTMVTEGRRAAMPGIPKRVFGYAWHTYVYSAVLTEAFCLGVRASNDARERLRLLQCVQDAVRAGAF